MNFIIILAVLLGLGTMPSWADVGADTAPAQATAPATHDSATQDPATHDSTAVSADHVWLMRDFWDQNLPNNYRSMQSPFKLVPGVTPPTRQGMDELHASGSGEFTAKSLKLLKQRLPKGMKLTVVDLMQESHAFVDGLAVAWYCGRNQINWGKTDEQIRQDEDRRLHSLRKDKEATTLGYVKPTNPEGLETGGNPLNIKVKKAKNEEELCHSMGIQYVRIPIPDDMAPPQAEIDRFVKLVEHMDKNTWLHVHCAAGSGRTTTFMAFFDMMHNAHAVSFEDIINRQWLIGGFQLINGKPSAAWKAQYAKERLKVIRQFYDTWKNKTLESPN